MMKILKLAIACLAIAQAPLQAQFNNGTQIFDESFVHQIHVTTTYPALVDSLNLHYAGMGGDGAYILCSVTIDGTPLDSVGIKEKGNYSNWGNFTPKSPLKFDFAEFKSGQKYDGVKKINLNNGFQDPSMMREAVCFRVMREAGLAAPRTAYAQVYFNGAPQGLFILVEEHDKNFLENHFPDKNGNLYKANNSDLTWDGPLKVDYTDNFEQGLRHSGDTSFADLIHLHDIINNSGSHFYDSLQLHFQTQDFAYSMAMDYLSANWDNLIGHGRNFSLYHSTTNDLFHWLPWDYNLSLSHTPIDLLWSNYPCAFWADFLQEPVFEQYYFDAVCSINENYFNNTFLDIYINQLKAVIRPALAIDPNYPYAITDFDNCLEQDVTVQEPFPGGGGTYSVDYKGLKSMIAARHLLAQNELAAQGHQGCLVSAVAEVADDLDFRVYPTPTNGLVYIENTGDNAPTALELWSTSGQLLYQTQATSNLSELNLSTFPAGMYLLRIVTKLGTQTEKVLKY